MILAIDTATRWTGLALHSGSTVIAEFGWLATNTQTIEIAPTTQEMLRKTGMEFSDLAAIAVTVGPGSYTGLRVGMSFAKGIALAHKLPLIGVDTLDIVVEGFDEADAARLIVIAEAGRRRVSAAAYRWYSRKGWQVKIEADIYEWETLLKKTQKGSRFAGEISAESRKLIRAANKEFTILPPAKGTRRAGNLAEIAHRRLRKNLTDNAAALAPIYLREPGGGKKQ